MLDETIPSIAVMVLVAAPFAVAFTTAVRRASRPTAAILAALSIVAGIAAIWLVDVNVPLSDSHWQSDGRPVPAWIALVAWLGRLAPIAAIAAGLRVHARERSSDVHG